MDKILFEIDNLLKEKDYKIIQEKIVILYFNLGKYIYNNKCNIYQIEDILRKKYGLLIGFTRRNLMNMSKFYSIYKNYDINILKLISWDNHLIIMKQQNKDELLNYCLKYSIDKNNLRKIIKNGFDIKYTKNTILNDDIVTLEIIKYISSIN